MIAAKRSWSGSYTSARGLWWLYGLIAVLALVGGGAAAMGQLERWAELSHRYGGWLFALVLVPLALVVMRSMFPRAATIELTRTQLRIVRGKLVSVFDLGKLALSTKRWSVAPGHEQGTVLVLDDGGQRLTIGVRDRRIGEPVGDCRSPTLWIEGVVLDELLPHLPGRLEVVRPDDGGTERTVSVELIRNSNRGGAIALLVGGIFGGMFLVIGVGIVVSRFYPDAAETLLMFMVPAIYGPMIAMFTYHRRGKVKLTVEPDVVTVVQRGSTIRIPRDELNLTKGTVTGTAQYSGSYETPALTIALPGGGTLDFGAHDVRLKWAPAAARVRATRYLVGSMDFQLLLGALGLSESIRVAPSPA